MKHDAPIKLLTNKTYSREELIEQLREDVASTKDEIFSETAFENWYDFIDRKSIFTELNFYEHFQKIRKIDTKQKILSRLFKDFRKNDLSYIDAALDKSIKKFISDNDKESPNSRALSTISYDLACSGHSPALNIVEIGAFLTPEPPEVASELAQSEIVEYIKLHGETYSQQIAIFRNYLYVLDKDRDSDGEAQIWKCHEQLDKALTSHRLTQPDDFHPLQTAHYQLALDIIEGYYGYDDTSQESAKWTERAEYIRGTLSILAQSKQIYYENDTLHVVLPADKIKEMTNENQAAYYEKIKELTPGPRLNHKLDLRLLPTMFEAFGGSRKRTKDRLMFMLMPKDMSLNHAVLAEMCLEAALKGIDTPEQAKGNYKSEEKEDAAGERKEVYSYAPPGQADAFAEYLSPNPWRCSAEISIHRKSVKEYLRDMEAAIKHARGNESNHVLLISPNIPADRAINNKLSESCRDKESPSIIPITLHQFNELLHIFRHMQQQEMISSLELKEIYDNTAESMVSLDRTKPSEAAGQIALYITKALKKLINTREQRNENENDRGNDQGNDHGR